MTVMEHRHCWMLTVSLAALAVPCLAAAADKPVTDVTITVVEDPKQLTEKVNTISLPAADDESHALNPAAKAPGAHARNDREETRRDHEDPRHDAADNVQGDSAAAKSDAADAHSDVTESINKTDD